MMKADSPLQTFNSTILGDNWDFMSLKLKKANSKKRKKIKTHQVQQTDISPQIYSRFTSYLSNRRKKFLKERLHDYYGKNFPINYRQAYNFEEQWKNNSSNQETDNLIQSNSQSSLQVTLSIMTIITFSMVIWITNINFFFHMETHAFLGRCEVFAIGLILQIVNAYLKLKKKLNKENPDGRIKAILRIISIQILTIPYFLAKLFLDSSKDVILWVIFEFIVWVILYFQASKRYYSLRLLSICLFYEYQTKLLDMLITIFIVAHFISIALYSASCINPDQSWLSALNIDHSNSLIVYIYAFYFCVTTIMTVGYGDITPKNYGEVMIVSLVQIFGIIMFGFMINQIGYCLSSLRKSRETMEKDLFMIQKLKAHYKMNQKLTNKVRSYLVYTKPKLDQVSPEQQKSILMKLNQQIRQDMIKQNMVSIVRSSIFFICRWTRHFQNSISNNLVHIMVNPDDILYQPVGKERIYIIKSGKIHIYAQRMRGKNGINTPLKSIQNNIKKEVSDNCFGYSTVISTRPTKLYAISTNFTSCYYIEKPNFLESVNQKISDFQYFHEMKNKLDQAKSCETYEIPLLESTKHHYSPSISLLLKKYSHDKSGLNKRTVFRRLDKSVFRGIKRVYDEQLSKHFANTYFNSFQTNLEPTEKESGNTMEVWNQSNTDELARYVIEKDIINNFHHYFEASKEYTNYFPNHNQQEVLRRYENSFYFPGNEEDLNMDFSLKMYKQVTAAQKQQINHIV